MLHHNLLLNLILTRTESLLLLLTHACSDNLKAGLVQYGLCRGGNDNDLKTTWPKIYQGR